MDVIVNEAIWNILQEWAHPDPDPALLALAAVATLDFSFAIAVTPTDGFVVINDERRLICAAAL